MARGSQQRQPGDSAEVIELDTGDFEAVGGPDNDHLAPPVSAPVLPPTKILPSDPQRAVPTSIYPPEQFEGTPSARTMLLPEDEQADLDEQETEDPGDPDEEETTVEGNSPLPAPRPPSAGALLEPAFLVVEKGPGAGRSVPLFEGELTIGRSSTCSLHLPLPSISRHHATMLRQGDRFVLRDEGSHNGTYVNGRQVNGELELRSGDEISLGKATLVLRAGATDPGQLTSTSVGVPDRPWMKLTIFAAAMVLGILTVFAVAGLKRSPQPPASPAAQPTARAPEATPPAEPVRDEPRRPAAPAAAAASDAPDFGEGGGEALLADEVYEDTQRGDERLAEIEVPKRPAERRVERRPAKAKPSRGANDSSAARASYEAGDFEGAINLARKAGANELATKIASFKKELGEAKAALSFKDGAGAIRHFSAALTLDREVSEGTSKQGREVRSQLSKLYLAAGAKSLEQGDAKKAEAFLDRAVKYDGTNERARELLERARSGAGASAKTAADEAFGP